MKNLILLLILAGGLLTSCQKDGEPEPQDDADAIIDKLEDYCIFVRFNHTDNPDISKEIALLNFRPGKMVDVYVGALADKLSPPAYKQIGDNTLEIQIPEFSTTITVVIENDVVKSFSWEDLSAAEHILIEKPETNLLRGNAFSGTYYGPNGSIWHEDASYSFSASGNTVAITDANGVRSEEYELIANIGALVDGTDLMIRANNKLEVNYTSWSPIQVYYGSFD